jgi:hypothetical protein
MQSIRSALFITLHGHRIPVAALAGLHCCNVTTPLDSSDKAHSCFSFMPLKRNVEAVEKVQKRPSYQISI